MMEETEFSEYIQIYYTLQPTASSYQTIVVINSYQELMKEMEYATSPFLHFTDYQGLPGMLKKENIYQIKTLSQLEFDLYTLYLDQQSKQQLITTKKLEMEHIALQTYEQQLQNPSTPPPAWD